MKVYKINGFGEVRSFSELYDVVHDKYIESDRDWASMNDREQMVLLARWFTMEVTGSGVTPIFLYALGEYISTIFGMLEYVGAVKTRSNLKKIESLYGNDGVPSDVGEREDRFFELEDTLGTQFSDLIDEVDDYLFSGEEIIEQLLVEKLSSN